MTPAELRAFRTAHHLTQPQLAAALGVAALTVSYWERGIQKPPPYLERALRDLAHERGQESGD